MPLSWNEIKDRALRFSRKWADESSEDAEAKSFLDEFFEVFGLPRRRVATFEHRVKKQDGKDGYIDLLWKGILLVEQKSRGKDLDRAFQQAKDYFPGLKDRDAPRYVLVCDFARFRLYDLEQAEQHDFILKDFYKNVRLFGFIAGYQTTAYKEQDAVNVKAAERMGRLHDKLKAIGYDGHELEVYLVRLLFCLFAEDTSIFERRQFQDLIEQRTAEDGQDLAQWLANLFEVLDKPHDKRLKTLDEQLSGFPYVNGKLYSERLAIAAFDREMRDMLLEACALDWSRISPAIFGALFQSVMDQQLRRDLGAHYTSEKNILKLISPLFLDELRGEFQRLKNQPKKLYAFHQKLAKLKFLDPACGCGNFLVIAYRELRLLELEVLRTLYGQSGNLSLDVAEFNILCDVDQFYGIEIEEFPAQIAQTALWLMDHQMNMQVSEELGSYFVRLPLKKSATIVHGNALQIDWRAICPAADYVLGNPPFLGYSYQSPTQKADLQAVFHDVQSAGLLDFVAAWYRKATDYMAETPITQTAFVSTNSITQGEQVSVLWGNLLKRGIKIHFAHRTFQWSNEAKGKAAVHCVIIGFHHVGWADKGSPSIANDGLPSSAHPTRQILGINTTLKYLYEYETINGEAQRVTASNINPYLLDAPTVLIEKRRKPLCGDAPEMIYGSKPTDGGHLLLSAEDAQRIRATDPIAAQYIQPFLGAEEFINGIERYCLWLLDSTATDRNASPEILKRTQAVKAMRLASPKVATQKLATMPHLFGEVRQPNSFFVVTPLHSSENRFFIPIGYYSQNVICGNANSMLPNATLYHFGILCSSMHNAWMRTVCGRLKSDYRYSNTIVYNNFPWPSEPSAARRQLIDTAAQQILDARQAEVARCREKHQNCTLADLYNPLTMPPELVKAHQKLDMAVDAAYSKKKFSGDSDRVAFLFELYQKLLSELETQKSKSGRKG